MPVTLLGEVPAEDAGLMGDASGARSLQRSTVRRRHSSPISDGASRATGDVNAVASRSDGSKAKQNSMSGKRVNGGAEVNAKVHHYCGL